MFKKSQFIREINDDPLDDLIIAIYKQAVKDLIASSGVSKRDKESARIFLESTETGEKCLRILEKEGLYNGKK